MPEENVRAMWSEDELDRALAALRTGESPDDQAFHRAKAELLVSAGAPAPEEPPAPSRRRWGWWAAAGTMAAVVASLLVVQTVRTDNRVPDTVAVRQLNLAADRINAVDEPLGPGEYRYISTHAWWMSTAYEYSYLAENLLETWVPADETQEWLWRRDVTGARKWLAGTEPEAQAANIPLEDMGWPEGEWQAPCGDWFAEEEQRKPCSIRGSWQSPNAEFMASLPREPEELYDRLRDDVGDRGEAHMVIYVADILRSGLVPADLRAALYRVLARVPGLEITEQVANLDGAKGTAYGISQDGIRHEVIIDPATGQFIGERQITEKGFAGIPAGTVIDYTSVTTAVVPGMGVRPTG
jgi:hypothetical protein